LPLIPEGEVQVKDSISRREWLARGLFAGAALWLPRPLSGQAGSMVVYKDPGCGCCTNWVEHVRAAGFEVSARNTTEMAAIRRRYRVPAGLASCHTAVVAGYVIEGHVPADLVRRLLREKPAVTGLTVPGMVTGSPGMEGAFKDPYDVLSFDTAGKTAVFARR